MFLYEEIKQSNQFKLKDFPVFFNDKKCLKVIEKIIDQKGKILNFPGIFEDDHILKEKRIGQIADVRFEAQLFLLSDSQYLMLWLIQPNGFYWMDDDGFGMTNDASIVVYTLVNDNGIFEGPFKLFSINHERYCLDFDDIVGKY